jgi:hypothetical protein
LIAFHSRIVRLIVALGLVSLGTTSLVASTAQAASMVTGLPAGAAPLVGIDSRGDAVLVWENGYFSHPGCCDSYFSNVEAMTGSVLTDMWLAPVEISPVGYSVFAGMAVDPAGDAVAIWDRASASGVGWVVETAFRPAASGVWGGPTALPGISLGPPHVAIDAQGDAVALWHSGTMESSGEVLGGPYELAVRSAATGTWETPVELPQSAGNASPYTMNPLIGVDTRGDVVVAWDADGVVEAAVRTAGSGGWQAVVDLSEADPPSDVGSVLSDLVVDPQGEAIVAWERMVAVGAKETRSSVQTAIGSAISGAWQGPVSLTSASAGVPAIEPAPHQGPAFVDRLGDHNPVVAIGPNGNAVAAWERSEGEGGTTIEAAVRLAGGGWKKAVQLSPTGEWPANDPQVAVDARGDAIAVWGFDGVVMGATFTATGTGWQAPVQLSPDTVAAGGPQLAANAAGEAIVVWPGDEVEAQMFDLGGVLSGFRSKKPVIVRAGLSHRRFRVGARHSTSPAPIGTSFRVTLSTEAWTTITLDSLKPGLRHGHTCTGPTAALRRAHAAPCTRALPLKGTFSGTRQRGTAGTLTVHFAGTLYDGGDGPPHQLVPGKYMAVITATNTAGSARPVNLRFTVVR